MGYTKNRLLRKPAFSFSRNVIVFFARQTFQTIRKKRWDCRPQEYHKRDPEQLRWAVKRKAFNRTSAVLSSQQEIRQVWIDLIKCENAVRIHHQECH